MPCGSSATSSRPCAGSSSRSRSASSSSGSSSAPVRGGRSSAPPIPASGSGSAASSAPMSPASGSTRSCPRAAGDVVKLYLIKHRIEGATYATLTPTLVAETIFDFVRRRGADRLGARDRRAAHPPGLLAAAVGRLGLLRQAREVDRDRSRVRRRCARDRARRVHRARRDARERVMRGFAIIHDPRRLVRGVVVPQALSWVFRVATRLLLPAGVPGARNDPQRAARPGRRLALDALPRDPGRRRDEAGPDRLPLPRRGDLEVAPARLQRRDEHRASSCSASSSEASRCS